MRISFLLTVLLMYFFSPSVLAQKAAKVKSFVQTTDHIQSKDRRNDMNNVPCALVKVQVVDAIERVEGNNMGDIINFGVEKWIYMCKGSRNMKIHLRNHLPVLVKFADYKIKGLESNRVYELIIELPDEAPSQEVETVKGNNLQMSITPSHAIVTIKGEDSGSQAYRPQDDGTLNVFLPYGRYYYTVEADGYDPMEGTVFVNDENTVTTVALSAIKGGLSITCPTEKVDFYVNNQLLNKNAKANKWSGDLPAGSYLVEARRNGCVTQSRNVEVLARQHVNVEFERLMTISEQKKATKVEEKKQKEAQAKEKKALDAAAKKERKEKELREKAERAEMQKNEKQRKNAELAKKLQEKEKKPIVIALVAGYNMATASFTDEYKGETKPMSSFHVGATVDFRLSNSFYVNTGLLFSSKGYEYKSSRQISEKGTAQYLDIPVQASVRFPIGKSLKLQLNAGPYAALCVGGKVEDQYSGYYKESFGKVYSSLDYGLQAGVGLDIVYHFHLGVSYQLGMEKKYQNRNLMVTVGYRF